jgi:tetratricopeptide (TPR) repeat protein
VDAIAEQLLARLRVDPRDRDAYDALRAHYVHSQDLASLADLLESWAVGHADDRQLASDAWTEAADAVLQSGGDRSRAKTLYRRALELNVLHPRAGERLRELLETDTDFKGLVEILDPYARALESAGGAPNYIAGLYQRLAELWQHAFERPDIAESYRQRAAELSGSGGRLGASSHDDDARNLAAEYERNAGEEAEPERKAALYLELAKIRQARLHDLDGAILALREARSAAPTDLLIMHQLASALLTQSQRLEPQAARVAQRRAGELFYQIAQAIDESQALPYLESALASMPDHEGSLAMLERVAPTQDQEQLLPTYWVRFVASAGDGPEADQRRLWLGRAYLQSGQFEDAIYCLQPAVEHHFEGADELLAQAYAGLGSDPGFQDYSSSSQPSAPVLREGSAAVPPLAPVPEMLSVDERAPGGVFELRKRVRAALAARYNDEAAELCRSILALDPADGEAFNLLESHLRKRGDYAALRQLLLGTTRVATLPTDTRRVRLREVALLSEGKLRDAEAALSAWHEVLLLDPSDYDAASHLKRLLYKAQRWDELCSVLEREALATTELDAKVVVLRELAHLHRDKRKDALQTAEVLRKLHSLLPEDAGLRAEFCEALIAIEQWTDAVPLLRDCIAHSKEEHDELKYSHLLASVLHEKLSALEDAHRVCQQILDFKPLDKSAFERMERIDEESGNNARLLSTLERRALLAAKSERPALLIRMASIAEQRLHDLDKAAGYLGDALDLSPEDDQALTRLCEMLQGAGRADRLLELLRERSQLPGSSRARAAVLRRMADTQLRALQDQDGAAASYRKLLELEEDERALRFLRDFAARKADMQQLCDVLQRLALCVTDAQERRDLLYERAVALHERLSSLAEAVSTLKHILERLDPSFEPAIELLLALSVRNRDAAGLALALERKLQLAAADARLPLIERLADTYEHDLGDGERAIGALEQWTREDPVDPEPYRRMRALLFAAQKWSALLVVLDALKEREESSEARDQSVIEGARIAFERVADVQGAWRRLLPLLEQRNLQAAALLHEIAAQSGRQSELAALYIQLAQRSADGPTQASYWRTAADIFERELHDSNQALEASLRMLATDLDNRDFLAQVDRLAAATKAFRRLTQVYDKLLKHDQSPTEHIKLLERLADLLEHDHPEEALARVLQACKLAPLDDTLLARAEALAQRSRRSEELLPLYDRRSESSLDDGEKVRLMLRAARLCDGALRDREQATQYLRKALGMAGTSAQLTSEVEAAARELDWARPDLGKDNARRALVRSYRETAQHADPELAERLVLRATQLLQSELDDERSAFDMLLQGISLLPGSDALYAALRAMADTRGRLDAIDAQLARSIEDATDLTTSLSVLRRRGSLLEDALGRFQDAAAVYAKLVAQKPDDNQASDRLRVNLRRSGRYQELLAALGKQLQRTPDGAARLGLLKEVASTWETDLRNRWEALDAWKLVLAEQPQDRDAHAALERLERGHPGIAERSGAGRPESTLSFAIAEPGKPREVAITDRWSEPAAAFEPGPGGEADPAFAPSHRPEADSSESEAEPDDLAALDADVSARMAAVEEIDGFDDMEGIPELEIRPSLPLPPAKRGLLPPMERVTPPPPPPPPRQNAGPIAARKPPPPPPPGDSPSPPLPALPKRAGSRGGVSE